MTPLKNINLSDASPLTSTLNYLIKRKFEWCGLLENIQTYLIISIEQSNNEDSQSNFRKGFYHITILLICNTILFTVWFLRRKSKFTRDSFSLHPKAIFHFIFFLQFPQITFSPVILPHSTEFIFFVCKKHKFYLLFLPSKRPKNQIIRYTLYFGF